MSSAGRDGGCVSGGGCGGCGVGGGGSGGDYQTVRFKCNGVKTLLQGNGMSWCLQPLQTRYKRRLKCEELAAQLEAAECELAATKTRLRRDQGLSREQQPEARSMPREDSSCTAIVCTPQDSEFAKCGLRCPPARARRNLLVIGPRADQPCRQARPGDLMALQQSKRERSKLMESNEKLNRELECKRRDLEALAETNTQASAAESELLKQLRNDAREHRHSHEVRR